MRGFEVIGDLPVSEKSQDDFPLVPPHGQEPVANADLRHGRWSIVDMRYTDPRFGGHGWDEGRFEPQIAYMLPGVRVLPALAMMSSS